MAKVKSAASMFAVSLVVLGLLFVGSTALAITFYLQTQKAEADALSATIRLSANMTPADETLTPVQDAKTAAAADGKTTVVAALAHAVIKRDLELKQKDTLLQKKDTEVSQASADAEKKGKEIKLLTTSIETLRAETKAKLDAAESAADADKQAAAAAKAEAALKISSADSEIKKSQELLAKAIEGQQAALAEKDAVIAAKARDLDAARSDADRLKALIRLEHRVVATDVATPVATISQVLPNGEVALNLGSKDHVRPGLTFEVFPSGKIIHMEAGNIVAGKATIEVYTVGEHDSVARLVRGSLATHLAKGDQLVNLAFHPHNDINITVYGVFDINHTGNPNGEPEDESRIKALISSAGAKVLEFDANDPKAVLSPTIDYLVLGADPKPPADLSQDEADVPKVEAHKRAQKAYATYHSLLAQARQMQVPVLNQNRFLELIGFYHRNVIPRK